MKITSRTFPVTIGLITILLLHGLEPARAGWVVNVGFLDGKGTVTVKVTSSTGAVTQFTTPYTLNPSAAINPQPGSGTFTTTGALPSGANPGTYVQVRGLSQYRTTIQSANVGGDLGDIDELLPFVLPTSACAATSVEVVAIQSTSNSITFQFKANLSDEGSAALLRIYDTNTLKQKYAVLLVGPYNNTTNTCEGIITVSGDPAVLSMLLEGTTSTLPFNITCPPNDIVLDCGSPLPLTYNPPATVFSTLPYALTYNPAPANLVVGITNLVTATATDTNGCTVSCQFKVYRPALVFDGFFAPIAGESLVSCGAPLRTVKLGNVVPVKFKLTCGGVPVTSGTPTIHIERCTGGFIYDGPFQPVNDEFHFNIDSTIIGTDPSLAGKYTITANLPDGSQHFAVLQYKK